MTHAGLSCYLAGGMNRPSPPAPYTLNLANVPDPIGTILEIGERHYTVVAAGPRELTWSGA